MVVYRIANKVDIFNIFSACDLEPNMLTSSKLCLTDYCIIHLRLNKIIHLLSVNLQFIQKQADIGSFLCFLAPPAERQRSFSNADSSVVRRRRPSSVVVVVVVRRQLFN